MSRFLTHDEALDVARSWDRHLPAPPTADAGGQRRKGSIERLPASRLLWYAKALCNWLSLDDHSDVILVAFETGIWNEHRPLEQTVRDRLPNSETVETKPALLADADDLEYLVSYTFVGLGFGWGLTLISRAGSRWVIVDHDGHVWIGPSDTEEARIAQETWLDG